MNFARLPETWNQKTLTALTRSKYLTILVMVLGKLWKKSSKPLMNPPAMIYERTIQLPMVFTKQTMNKNNWVQDLRKSGLFHFITQEPDFSVQAAFAKKMQNSLLSKFK